MEKISNHGDFSWAELFSNDNGKTSGTAFCGIVVCLIGAICFLLGCVDKMWISHSTDIITQSIVFVGIGVTLMGVRKVVSSNDTSSTTATPPVQQVNS